tara:strand:- start:305 stop:529 length:225 start_codon:yes stop_codon:yes gene_type:complete
VEQLQLGSLIHQSCSAYVSDQEDLGIVVSIKEREIEDDYVQIYWFRSQRYSIYLDLEVTWYLWGGHEAIWKIVG